MTSRRAFLAALPAAGAAAALPLAATATDNLSAPGVQEPAASRVEQLMMDLSEALDECLGGQFRAIVEPASAPGSNVVLVNMTTSLPSLERRHDQAVGIVNVDGLAVVFDHSIAPAVTRVDNEELGLVAHGSHPEAHTRYLVLDAWGKLQVAGLDDHTDYGRLPAHPRMAFSAARSSAGREYLEPVLVIGKVLEQRPLRA